MRRLLLIALLVSSAVSMPGSGSRAVAAGTTPAPGDLDPGFSGNGLLVLRDAFVPRIAATPDGGSFASNGRPDRWVVTKLTVRGSLDRTFSGNGRERIDVSFLSGPEVAVDRDGGIVGAGIRYRRYGSSVMVVRLSAGGHRLPSFGRHGVAWTDPFPDEDEVVTGVVVQPSGRIVVGGYTFFGPGDRRSAPFLLGLTATGQLDPRFGDGGLVVTKLARRSVIHSFAMTASGAIVGVGAVYPDAMGVVARWHANGTTDRTFGDQGVVLWPAARSADHVAIMAGGGVLMSGGVGSDGLILRLMGNGVVDPSFGSGGTATLPAGEFGEVVALVVQDNGFALAVTSSGESDNDILAVRMAIDGRLDPSFGVDGVARIVRRDDDLPIDAALDVSGKLLVTGWTYAAGPRKTLVARLLT
jgi:uncharacterized delta-60 repeat protein